MHTVPKETLYVCIEDLNYLFIRQNKLWNYAQLMTAMVTASAGTLL